jgi:PhoH-like ATPase
MVKNFVLDTNVLIHNPNSLYSFTDNNVIIPITVIEELDKFKSSSDKKGMHARQALREIDSCIKKGALKKGAKLSNGGTLKIELGTHHIPLPNLDLNKEDNKIISVAYELHHRGETVFFISKDVNARIKAEAIGIKARDYEKQLVEYSSLYKGWREINLTTEEINALYKNHEIELKGYTLYENEYILVKSSDGGNSSAICRYNKSINKLEILKENYEAMGIKPLNLQQKYAFDLLLNDNISLVTLVGQAGTGKTLIAIACGLEKTKKE